MSKKSTAKRHEKKAAPVAVAATTVVATAFETEMSYDDMLTELEAIVSEAGVRLAEEEGTL